MNGHPVNSFPTRQFNITSVIAEAAKLSKDSISPLEYTRWIKKGIFHIGCIHTSINDNPLLAEKRNTLYLPLTVLVTQEGLMITGCIDSSKVNQVITKVNGIEADSIIQVYAFYRASDGGSDAFSREYFHYNSSRLVPLLLNNPKRYNIKTINDEFSLDAQSTIFLKQPEISNASSPLKNKNNALLSIGGFDILKVNSFSKSDKRFYAKVFKRLNQIQSKKLLVDLRGNIGGNRKAAIALTAYLADSTFGYAILQPKKLKTSKYLNGKGKFYLLLSKLKYNVGLFYKRKGTPLGGKYTYSSKPKKKYHYTGKIYVLTDGFTASASTMVTSWLKQHANATFMGTQSGGGYNGNNGGSFPLISLPNSGIEITFPAYRIILDEQSSQYTGITPEIVLDTHSDLEDIIKDLE
ncbi:MAG: S41 family peptidase [Thermonemataceae bacterium]